MRNLVVMLVVAGTTVGAGEVTAPPEAEVRRLELAPFYRKYLNVGGLPVVASEQVSDYALLEAGYIVSSMLAQRPELLEAIGRQRVRLAIMAPHERTTDLPEHSDLQPKAYWDRRARGLGSTPQRPAISCGEENLLNCPGDPYDAENILVHEFAHTIHQQGMRALDPTFDQRLRACYEAALKEEKWQGTYAAQNRAEYWAEGVQSWFDTNRANDHQHNEIDTREELQQYDPQLASLLTEVFGDNPWRYVRTDQRTEAEHLQGLDRTRLPSFRWSAEEQQAFDRQVRARRSAKQNEQQAAEPEDSDARQRPRESD